MRTLERIKKIRNGWLFRHPAYYVLLCICKIEETAKTNSISCGGGFIYVNNDFFKDKTDEFLEECLMIECLRTMLKHPYQRVLPNKAIAYFASNIVIEYYMKPRVVKLASYGDIFNEDNYRYRLDGGLVYEEVYKKLVQKCKSGNGGDGSCGCGSSCGGDISDDLAGDMESAAKNASLWDEDPAMSREIDGIRDYINSTNQWGDLPNGIDGIVLAKEVKKFNYRNVIRIFRRNVISSVRKLTRMKPNRRFGYLEMGSKAGYTTNLLIVIDTSGSVSDSNISKFLGFIGGFFRSGIERLDVVQFDVKVYDETLVKFSKRPKRIKVVDRGGTIVEDIPKYVNERSRVRYDGVIVLTDGYFSYDKKYWDENTKNVRYLWCTNNEEGFKTLRGELTAGAKCTYVDVLDDDTE